jgi:hypothetical protein
MKIMQLQWNIHFKFSLLVPLFSVLEEPVVIPCNIKKLEQQLHYRLVFERYSV